MIGYTCTWMIVLCKIPVFEYTVVRKDISLTIQEDRSSFCCIIHLLTLITIRGSFRSVVWKLLPGEIQSFPSRSEPESDTGLYRASRGANTQGYVINN